MAEKNKNKYNPKQIIGLYRAEVNYTSNNAAKMVTWFMDTQVDEAIELKEAVDLYLKVSAELDPSVKKNLSKEGKSLDRCVSFICTEARKRAKSSNCCAISKMDVFNLATHYYDEDNIDIDKMDDKTVKNIQKRTEVVASKAVGKKKETRKEAKMLDLFG